MSLKALVFRTFPIMFDQCSHLKWWNEQQKHELQGIPKAALTQHSNKHELFSMFCHNSCVFAIKHDNPTASDTTSFFLSQIRQQIDSMNLEAWYHSNRRLL